MKRGEAEKTGGGGGTRRRGCMGCLGRLALLAAAVLAAAALAEYALRALGAGGEHAGQVRHVRLRERPPGVEHRVEPGAAYREAVGEAFRPGRHRIRIDDRGFVEPSRMHWSADLDVVFLGGSTTESLYVEEEERFPYLVGRRLERPGRRVNAWNAGVAGNSTLDSLNRLVNVVLPLEPDVVVVMHNVNDLAVLLHAGTYWNELPTRGPVVRETLRGSLAGAAREVKNRLVPRLYLRLRTLAQRVRAAAGREEDEFAAVRGKGGPVEPERIAGEFAANLRAIVGVCRARGVRPVLMTMPSRLTADPDDLVRGGMGNLPLGAAVDYEQVRVLFERFNETVREVGRSEAVEVIDLAWRVEPQRRFIYDVVHFTEEGSRLVAGIVAAELERMLDDGGGAEGAGGGSDGGP